MQYIQAKKLGNKLGMIDNQPFAIDRVIFLNDGFMLILISDIGEKICLSYDSLEWFREDFNIFNSRKALEKFKELTAGDAQK